MGDESDPVGVPETTPESRVVPRESPAAEEDGRFQRREGADTRDGVDSPGPWEETLGEPLRGLRGRTDVSESTRHDDVEETTRLHSAGRRSCALGVSGVQGRSQGHGSRVVPKKVTPFPPHPLPLSVLQALGALKVSYTLPLWPRDPGKIPATVSFTKGPFDGVVTDH